MISGTAKLLLFFLVLDIAYCNRPPRFLIDGQTEIVLRLKEGDETPVGTLIYKLRGIDPDGDKLEFGVRKQSGSNVIRVETVSAAEANVYLAQPLDRETRDEYALVLTLTDGRLGHGNYVTQSLLLLVEDVNDNTPVFKPYQPTISIKEDAETGVIATLEATDADEGAYGQVVYHLQESESESKFSISTLSGKGVIRLIGNLDYETQTLHQLKVLAVDRAKQGRVNTGTAALLVKVEDVEDQPPEFVKVQPVARVAEDAPVGTPVLQVTAVDGDRGVNNPIAYSLSSNGIGEEIDLFRIERQTGNVITTKLLDRESTISGAYILQITATEIGSKIRPVPSATTEVTIMITDVNDETPTFKSTSYQCEVPENAPTNTPLTFSANSIAEVYDLDQGNNGTFQLLLKQHGEIFEVTPSKAINEATFLIRVKNSSALDYEVVKRFNLSLVARETVKYSAKSSEVSVIVDVLDRNDNYPEFTKSIYDVWVPENCPVGTTVAWVQALDDDSGAFGTKGVRYTNLAGSLADLLDLDASTGVITVKSSGGANWDREVISRHYLTVEARDDLGNGNRNTVQLVINLEDVNDNAPVFSQSKYEARLMENEANFEVPLKLDARDGDLNGTKNSEIEYSLHGIAAGNFTIEPNTGVIRPKAPLDFESFEGPSTDSTRIVHLTARASDWGDPVLYTEVPIVIYVLDANDHAPVFEELMYNKSIPENIPSGTSIFQVKAYDLDGSSPNNRLVYRIQSGASDKFTIGAETGIISIARGASLDPDLTQPTTILYSLNVIALDGATGENQKKANVTVKINILDVNNKSPVFVNPGMVSITENTPVGTEVTRVRAKDLDATANLRYKLDPTSCRAQNERGIVLTAPEFDCASLFYLEEVNGVLTVAKTIDREVVEIINLGLIVEDNASETGPQIDTAELEIRIEDVNDNNPKFRQPFYKFSVAENSKNGVIIGGVIADDADKNKSVTYTLEGRDDLVKLLYLNKNSGDLVVANRIDHEVYEWLNLTIKATDADDPPRSTRVELFVQILDENDNSPVFLPEPRMLKVPEDTAVGQKIAIVEAKDQDSGEFSKITYLLDRISSQGKFSLEPETGILRVAEELDRETKHSYLLVVEAWDNYQYGYNNGESRNAFKHINVSILDVNDNKPQLDLPKACVTITEFHDPDIIVGKFKASDADDPETPNAQIVSNFIAGNDFDLFYLRQNDSGWLEVGINRPLKGRHGNYTLTIRAQDMGTPSHSTQGDLNICVTDLNDHAPMFLRPPHNSTLKIPENATIGSALVQVIARDEDVGPNGAVRYRLKPDSAEHYKTFYLSPVSGILELHLPLNRSKQKIYDIRIEAYDLGVPSLSSEVDLTVYVSSINDYQPQFLIDEFIANFTENSLPGHEILRLPDTVDRDFYEYEGPVQICFFIVGGNENGLFRLNSETHELSVSAPLDREEQDTHLLLIKATEDCTRAPNNQSFFDSSDDSLLKVIVKVTDINDNPPKFTHRVFTGGVSTATSFGTKFMHVKAIDPDHGPNSEITYHLIGKVKMTLTEGLENLQRAPFIVEKETGSIQLNFDPQQGMKGYFDFMVMANDTGGLQDVARVFIYLLREDQRVRFILRQQPVELRTNIEKFREMLGNVTGAIVNVDEFKVHANHDGTVDKTRTDLYLHLVNRRDNSILEVAEVLKLVDQNTEKLDNVFKEFNVLDTQPGGVTALSSIQKAGTTFWLTASSLFLLLLLLLCLALCINQRHTYQRKLKAATTTAYGGLESDIDGRGLSGLSGRVPNTNKHSMEGSNPMWLKAYENEWYKNTDELSQGSDRDSLDENVLSSADDGNCPIESNRIQNVYQTLPPILPPRKMETTEL
ncbi:PREDICTED: cadherin-23 [Nicrophorus vespilloides]|uniref:Cadherin-23 n=1 Tax=Nicrophorus vespilloides TaxID=110193 RepID=A0ABM1MGV4_NICVS|nr:PREDICTED: cadherin-23 [Nicrophorus vespilloides]